MQKNDVITVIADGVGTQGEGIAKADGVTVFVPYLLPGERAQVRILKVKGNVAYGKAEEIVTPAEERVRPACPVFYRCGGCQLQHLRYRDQLKFKTGLVRDTLKKIGGVCAEVSPCERSDKEYGYRNKLQLPVGRQGEKNVVGFFAERSHRIIPTEECPIHPQWSKPLIEALLGFMEKCGLDGYDPETGKGQVRHIVVRELKKKYIVTLVVTVRQIMGIDYFTFLLDKIFPEYSLYLNFNDGDSNVVFGEEFIPVKGKGTYECAEDGILYEAGPNTFVQVNDGVRAKLYEQIVSLVKETDVVFDCYAGGGLLTAMLAKKCARVYGIEVVPEAGECARRVAQKNGLEDKMFPVTGRVEDVLPALLEKEDGVAVLDPPRAGLDRSVVRALLSAQPETIVLVSCNPATLARDLGLLTGTLCEREGELVKTEGGAPYSVSLVRPFDMFPQTRHVETLVVLKRVEVNGAK